MFFVSFIIGIIALLAAGNWLGQGIRDKHAASAVFGVTWLIGGVYFLLAAIGHVS